MLFAGICRTHDGIVQKIWLQVQIRSCLHVSNEFPCFDEQGLMRHGFVNHGQITQTDQGLINPEWLAADGAFCQPDHGNGLSAW